MTSILRRSLNIFIIRWQVFVTKDNGLMKKIGTLTRKLMLKIIIRITTTIGLSIEIGLEGFCMPSIKIYY